MAQITEEEILRLLPLVSDERREEALRYKHLFGQFACLKSYVMLREMLEQKGLTHPFRFGHNEHGKPYLTNYPDIHFNISHCDKAIAVAVSNHEVGIDVEGRRRFNESLLQRAMNDEEQAAIHKSSDPEMEFAKLWTRKEAYFKWTGTGILLDHLKSAEADAKEAGCIVKSRLITPEFGNDSFYLSVAEKEDE